MRSNFIPRFFATLKAGKLTLDFRKDFEKHVASLPDGKYQLVLEPFHKARSLAQNRAHFGLAMGLLAAELGMDREYWHAYAKILHFWPELSEAFGIKRAFAEFMAEASEDSIRRIGGLLTTTNMSSKEFSDFFEEIGRWATSDFGIVIPTPDEARINTRGGVKA